MSRFVPAALLLAGVVVAAPLAAQPTQSDSSFTWSGKIPAGRWIRVRSLNGPITVSASNGDNVEVTGIKRWRRGDPAVVRFETKKFGPDDESVVICALWGERSSCDERGYDTRGGRRERGRRDNDVSVEFRVLVPKGVRVGVSTVNGDVTVDGATSDAEGRTVNGDVEVSTSGGRAQAASVNGSVRARLGRLDTDGPMEFTTVNGNVRLELPADAGADLEMETVMGSLNTDFEMTVSGRMDPKHLRTHVGRPGGPRIRLETVNGSVEVRKRS